MMPDPRTPVVVSLSLPCRFRVAPFNRDPRTALPPRPTGGPREQETDGEVVERTGNTPEGTSHGVRVVDEGHPGEGRRLGDDDIAGAQQPRLGEQRSATGHQVPVSNRPSEHVIVGRPWPEPQPQKTCPSEDDALAYESGRRLEHRPGPLHGTPRGGSLGRQTDGDGVTGRAAREAGRDCWGISTRRTRQGAHGVILGVRRSGAVQASHQRHGGCERFDVAHREVADTPAVTARQ